MVKTLLVPAASKVMAPAPAETVLLLATVRLPVLLMLMGPEPDSVTALTVKVDAVFMKAIPVLLLSIAVKVEVMVLASFRVVPAPEFVESAGAFKMLAFC